MNFKHAAAAVLTAASTFGAQAQTVSTTEMPQNKAVAMGSTQAVATNGSVVGTCDPVNGIKIYSEGTPGATAVEQGSVIAALKQAPECRAVSESPTRRRGLMQTPLLHEAPKP